MSTQTSIQVVCKFRPLNDLERSEGGKTCIKLEGDSVTVMPSDEGVRESKFTFDKVFGPAVTQQQVFDFVGKPLLKRNPMIIFLDAMNGYNGTIFAYGQTSSGKTFTMEGRGLDDQEFKGLIPRVMDEVFEMIRGSSEKFEFTLRVTMLEIYNEKIQDLLDTSKNNLQVREDRRLGVYVADATEIYVNSPQEMRTVMKQGSENRSVAATRMNAHSSRSHSIFCMKINKKNLESEEETESRLYFVDLAGSEKISKTHVQGKQLDEAKNINKSLTTLGLVINALVESSKFVPYRNSKLTRILQESIGGNSLTTLVIAASMCSYNEKETLSTLQFGQRAKCIQNKVKQNVERSAKELERLLEVAEMKLREYEALVKKLGADPEAVNKLLEQATNSKADKEKEDLVTEDIDGEGMDQPPQISESLKPVETINKVRVPCISIGIQTDMEAALKQEVINEELEMLANMTEEEELAYLAKLEEEAMQRLEEEEKRAQEAAKPDVPAVVQCNHNEAAYIAQAMQLIDVKAEAKKLRDDLEALQAELKTKKAELEEQRDKNFEISEGLRNLQSTVKQFAEQMVGCCDSLDTELRNQGSRLLGFGRSLDELVLKLTYVSNDSDLKLLNRQPAQLSDIQNEALSDLSNA